MDETIAQEILHELFSALEALETQSAALLQFMKDKGLATEPELAPYFEQAGNASNVRWRAARVRIDYLLASAFKAADRDAQPKVSKPEEKEDSQKPAAGARSEKDKQVTEKDSSQTQDSQRTDKEAARAKLEARDVVPVAEDSDPHANPQRDRNDREAGEKENQNIKAGQAKGEIKEHAA